MIVLYEEFLSLLDFLQGRVLICHKLQDVLQNCHVPPDFDFLSVDTEGLDLPILLSFLDQSHFRPRLIITEETSFQDPQAFFQTFDYRLINTFGASPYRNLAFLHDPTEKRMLTMRQVETSGLNP